MSGIDHAHATLVRGTRFLGSGFAIEGPVRAKVIGNGLRELDRFLNCLIDEVAAAATLPGLDRVGLARQHNTANKLRALRAALSLPSPDHDRLRALGRSRACLFHCAGIVRRADVRGGAAMTSGWRAEPVQVAIGDRLAVAPADLADVCGFYDRVAGDLLSDSAPARA